LIVTPGISGADGIAAVSREVLTGVLGVLPSDAVEVWSLTEKPPELGHLDVRSRGAGGNRWRFVAWGLAAAIEARHDLVIALHLHLAPVLLPLTRRGTALAVFLHGIEAWRPLRGARSAAIRRAAVLVANSDYTAMRFRNSNPEHAARAVHVCHLGVPADALAESSASAVPWAGRAGHYALIVGRMAADERYKGHDLLLDIWPDVVRAVPDALLCVVGDGTDRQRLERHARDRGLDGQVKFLGRVGDDVLAALYRDCAFYVMPSRGEGFGLVFVEAMRAGKPCIAGVGAASEIIEHGLTGLLVDPRSSTEVLAAIVRLFQEPETRHAMGRAAEARFHAQFSAEQFHERLRAALGLPQRIGACVA